MTVSKAPLIAMEHPCELQDAGGGPGWLQLAARAVRRATIPMPMGQRFLAHIAKSPLLRRPSDADGIRFLGDSHYAKLVSVGDSRPPIRTGRIDRASPVFSSVSTTTAHKVPSPSAG